MKANMGTVDSVIRLLVAALILVLILAGKVTGITAIMLGVVGGIFVLTGFARICPLYLPFGINTNNKKQ